MRTIKFRGKSIDTNEWLYGDLVHSSDMERCAILVNDKSSYEECEVNPCTVGQFTGLYDCHDKEIYEGDILRIDNSPIGVCEVKWNERITAFCIRFCYLERDLCDRPLGVWVISERSVEIIGNIHDNPELMEGGEK